MIAWTTLAGSLRRITCAAIWIASSLVPFASLAEARCQSTNFDGKPFTFCEIDPAASDVRLWLNTASGERIGTFSRLETLLRENGRQLALAMNAGMYHPDRRPVGLYVEDGKEVARIVTRDGPGNFGLLPNGVLCLSEDKADVVESRTFAADPPDCRFAMQSGPMLVIDGELHPRFIPGSPSENIRNGAGVRADGTLVLAISDAPVNFDTFGRFFRDVMVTPNALFLDGRISRLYSRDLGRSDFGLPLGPIIGISVPID